MILRLLANWYFRVFGNSVLRKYESACIDAWRQELPEKAREILDWQLTQYDFIQRMSADKVVSFYCLKNKVYSSWPKDMFFPLSDAETPAVATVLIRPEGGKGKSNLRADILITSGRFFGIEFYKPPSEFLGGGDINKIAVHVAEVKLWSDVMQLRSTSPVEKIGDKYLTGWLKEWHEKNMLWDFRQPLSIHERLMSVERLGSILPNDYMELISQTEGATTPLGRIYGVSDIRSIVFPDGNYGVLVEVDGKGAIAINTDIGNGLLYFIDFDGEARPLGNSLSVALLSLLDTEVVR